jgi:hypothetical protein
VTTPIEIINQSLKDAGTLGVGQSALPEDVNDAFTKLNWMIAQWNRKRWLVYHLVDVAKVSTGAQSYTVGPGQDYDVAVRPDRLEAAFFRQVVQSQPAQIDYPLELIQAREDYNNIALKGLTSFPQYIFYDSAWPVGRVYPWPIPQANIYEVHLTLKMVLAQFTSKTQSIDLPNEYYAAIQQNLTLRLWPAYKQPPDATIVALAKDALNVIRGANTQIARLVMPTDLVRPGIYNPYSDQIR